MRNPAHRANPTAIVNPLIAVNIWRFREWLNQESQGIPGFYIHACVCGEHMAVLSVCEALIKT